ncbi:head-tail connector protein [Caulobacter sp. FWC26]|uniref:head-tail connector protein n=1 Tax=Caulobacter sp. FWC26 TaxID=69665 RepID=UPI000C1575CE|nr:head-tail connector protein [Caulobacter sp. FWC26]AZS20062.1 phage gp6-like head-tail connector protein [Caulobacter sp. FWC26]
MTVIVTLEEAKAWLRLSEIEDHEDTVIQAMIETATAEALHLADGLEEGAEEVPPTLKTAVLLHVTSLFEERSEGGVPPASSALARRHRNWSV